MGGATASACDARLREAQRNFAAVRDAARAAGEKQKAGRTLNRADQSALRRHKEYSNQIAFWSIARELPKVDYQAMSGRQTKILHDQARSYGLPVLGPTVDLARVIEWLHQAIADGRLHNPGDDDEGLGGQNSPALERLRAHKATLAEIEVMKARGEIFSAEEMNRRVLDMAGILRAAGEKLQRRFGEEARQILSDAIDDYGRQAERIYGGNGD